MSPGLSIQATPTGSTNRIQPTGSSQPDLVNRIHRTIPSPNPRLGQSRIRTCDSVELKLSKPTLSSTQSSSHESFARRDSNPCAMFRKHLPEPSRLRANPPASPHRPGFLSHYHSPSFTSHSSHPLSCPFPYPIPSHPLSSRPIPIPPCVLHFPSRLLSATSSLTATLLRLTLNRHLEARNRRPFG